MSKKTGVLIIAIAIALGVIALCIFALGGKEKPIETTPSTGPSSNEEASGPSSGEISANKAVMQQMEDSLAVLFETPENDTAEAPAFLTEVDKLNGYEILSFEESEVGAVAAIKVYAPDLYSIAKKLDSDGITRTEEELLEAISEALENAELIECELTLEFAQTGDSYAPILTAEFLDALYGGVFRLYDDLLSAE